MKAAITALCSAVAAPLLAQGGWVTPQPPCEISAAHFKVNGGVLHLKAAAEKPDQRTGQLAEARRVLVEAILQDKQDKNPGAWYYLGRYYFETGDAAGADSALARALALAPQCKQDIDGYRRRLWASTLNAGLAAWQGGKEDSAVALFGLAARLAPGNPKAFVALAGLYAGKDNYDSALVYYRRTVEAAGNDTAFAKDKRDALSNVARLLVGRAPAASAVFDSVAAHAQNFDPEDLFTAGQRLMSQRWYRAGARALALALTKNPYRRDALYSLGVGYYQLRDSTNLLAVAQRLVQLDPLNRGSLKLLAGAWDLRGRRDSTLKYVAQADSLLAVEVSVTSFVPDSAGAAVTLLATNLRPAASKPFRLTVEFLDLQGKPVASETRDVPAIPPQENQQLDGGDIARLAGDWLPLEIEELHGEAERL